MKKCRITVMRITRYKEETKNENGNLLSFLPPW